MFNSLLNPESTAIFMVFLPQFVDQTGATSQWQLFELGLILSVAAVAFNTVLGYFSGWIGQYLQRNPRFARKQSWFMAAVLCALAVRLDAWIGPRQPEHLFGAEPVLVYASPKTPSLYRPPAT